MRTTVVDEGSVSSDGDAPNAVVIPPDSMFFPNLKMESHGLVDVGTRNSKIISMNPRYVEQLVCCNLFFL